MKLFERVNIGKVTIPNRVGLAPMGMRGDIDGGYNERVALHFQRVARGGAGLIITGNTSCSTEFEPRSNFLLDNYQQISRLSKCVEYVHYEGSKIFLQLGPGLGRLGHKDPTTPPHAASAVEARYFPGVKCIPFTEEEIHRLVGYVAREAGFAKTAGCDGVEIHAYGGYLIDQFLTAEWNIRTDRYGGDLKGRMTFLFEILDAIRAACGPDFPIIVKVTVNQCMPEVKTMRNLEEGLEMCRLLKEHGNFDALHIDRGNYDRYYYQIPTVYEPHGLNLEDCRKVKEVMGEIPVLCHGKMNVPELAEEAVATGAADIVMLGHQLIADPEWANKVREGRTRDINFCIGCNECLHTGFVGINRTCAINPTSGREYDYPEKTASQPKRILVVGGGVGGINAAMQGDKMGHDVTLWEKTGKLGGLLLPAGAPAFKHDMKVYLDNLVHRLDQSGVKVVLNKEAKADEIIAGNWDAVIVATGSSPIVPPIPGIEGKNVVTANDALTALVPLKGKVVVIGGGLVGCEAAVHISQTAEQVYCVEMATDILSTADHMFNNDQSIRNLLAKSGTIVHCNTTVISIDEQGVTCQKKDGEQFRIDCDTVVTAIGFRPNNQMEGELWGKVKVVRTIGDAVAPRKVINAVNEGFHYVYAL